MDVCFECMCGGIAGCFVSNFVEHIIVTLYFRDKNYFTSVSNDIIGLLKV